MEAITHSSSTCLAWCTKPTPHHTEKEGAIDFFLVFFLFIFFLVSRFLWFHSEVNCLLLGEWGSMFKKTNKENFKTSRTCGRSATNFGGMFFPDTYLQMATTSRSRHLRRRAVKSVVLPVTLWTGRKMHVWAWITTTYRNTVSKSKPTHPCIRDVNNAALPITVWIGRNVS